MDCAQAPECALFIPRWWNCVLLQSPAVRDSTIDRANLFRVNLRSATSFEPNKGIHIGKRQLAYRGRRDSFVPALGQDAVRCFREIESDRS
jgi:hypothetical protein